jgi:hypothetical protein
MKIGYGTTLYANDKRKCKILPPVTMVIENCHELYDIVLYGLKAVYEKYSNFNAVPVRTRFEKFSYHF